MRDKQSFFKKCTLVNGSSVSGKNYLITKNLKQISKRRFFVATRSAEQYDDSFVKEEKTRKMKENEVSVVSPDGNLDHNQKQYDPFCTKGGHIELYVSFFQNHLQICQKEQ